MTRAGSPHRRRRCAKAPGPSLRLRCGLVTWSLARMCVTWTLAVFSGSARAPAPVLADRLHGGPPRAWG
jgi:hypothetical protein